MMQAGPFLVERTPVHVVRNNCVLTILAQALWSAQWGEGTLSCGWEDEMFMLQSTCTAQGAIVFDGSDRLVGLVQERDSSRNPYRTGKNDWQLLLRGAPPNAIELARSRCPVWLKGERLEWLHEPALTAAFWGNQDGIWAFEPREIFFPQGGSLFEDQLRPLDAAIATLVEGWELDPPAARLLNDVLFRRLGAPLSTPVFLMSWEMKVLFGHGHGTHAALALDYLGCINIHPQAA
jgi:hypothetical protein